MEHSVLKNEKGVALVIALILLVVLTMIGISRLPSITAYSGTIGSDENYRSGRLTDASAQPSKELGVMLKPGYETTWEFKRFQINATGESFGAKKEIEAQVSLGPYNAGTSYNN